MKWILTVLLVILGVAGAMAQQSAAELKQQLEAAKSSEDKMRISYELANALMSAETDKALEYARSAHQIARDLNSKNMIASSAFQISQLYERKRDVRNQEVWLRSATEFAKSAGDLNLILQTVEKRGQLAIRERKEQRAIEIYRDAFEYFSKRGTSIGELEQKYAQQKRQLERDKQAMEQDVMTLLAERDRLTSTNSELVSRQKDLLEEKKEVEQTVTRKERELASVSEEKLKAEEVAQQASLLAAEKEEAYNELSKEALAQQLVLEETRANLAEAELEAQINENFIRIAIMAAAFFIVLAILLFGRYSASRRAKKKLEEKNQIIERERERSDKLLLNILPGPIAEELKEKGKAKARRYEEVTVLFADFKNFTNISQALSPEELVDELDKCFQEFDNIISRYPDIEKIKTIGDAYMCAAGLSEQRTSPANMIRAALEIQEFLERHKQEKQLFGLPFFEARIGLHTGPVVAGVVGFNKFAYDIWGDTVNTAARVETNCKEGRVNISETTYQLVKDQFECEYRGMVEAKNKGPIAMYFVNKVAKAVPV